MKVYKYKPGEILKIGRSAIAIGFFDGVHLAHRELILTAIERARSLNIPAGVITFPSESSIKPQNSRIYSTEEKLGIIENLGVDFTVLCDFSDVRSLSGEEFVRDVLIGGLHAFTVVAGYNFRFGRGALSGAHELEEYMIRFGGEAIIKDAYLFDGKPLSSTFIRDLISKGKPDTAARALGAPYFLTGLVERGNGVGKTLGFPTVNFEIPEGRVKLKRGVYVCTALISGVLYPAVTNVGICPTFESRSEHIEVHLLDFSCDLYNEHVKIYFLEYLREERQFSSAEELKMQIKADILEAKKKNGEGLWQEIGRN